MQVVKSSNFGNPHIGLFARASDKLILAEPSCSPKFLKALEILGTPIEKVIFGSSGFPGIFAAMNSNGVIVPSFCSREEIAQFRSYGLNVSSAPAKFSAAGNNIAANDFGAVVNPEMQRSDVKRIEDCLGVEAVQMRLAGYAPVGACVVATNKGFAAHNRASEEELKALQSILRVDGTNCTLNTGTPFVSLGAVANSRAAIFGESCTGFEIGRASDALSLL